LKGGTRGKYIARYRAGTNLVLLSPDVAAHFPDEQSVNTALRSLIQGGNGPATERAEISLTNKIKPRRVPNTLRTSQSLRFFDFVYET